MASVGLTGLKLHCRNKKAKGIYPDKLWICDSIKIVYIKVKGPNDPVKQKEALQGIQ